MSKIKGLVKLQDKHLFQGKYDKKLANRKERQARKQKKKPYDFIDYCMEWVENQVKK